ADLDRDDHHSPAGGAAGGRLSGRRRGDQHPELRAVRPRRPRQRRRPEGGPCRGVADPVLSREPQIPGHEREGGGMNLLVVGSSHRTAPVELLEKLAVDTDTAWAMTQRLLAGRYVDEIVVLSTCNRVEIYAAVSGVHGGLVDIA